jgi:hypothetical protein
MTIRPHRSLIACCAAAQILAFVACGGGSPPSVLQPRLVVDREHPTKTVLIDNPMLGFIEDIRGCDNSLLVISAESTNFLRNGKLAPTRAAANYFDNQIIGADCDGSWLTVERSNPPAIACDAPNTRKRVFRFDGRGGPIIEVHGPDRRIAAVVTGGLQLLRVPALTTIAVRPGDFGGDLASGDLSGDSEDEIVTLEGDGNLRIRNANGDVQAQRQVGAPSWVVTRAQHKKADLVLVDHGSIGVFSPSLALLNRMPIPIAGDIPAMHIVGASEFGENRDLLGVLLTGRGGWHRTLFLIFRNGSLTRAEILEDDYHVIVPDYVSGNPKVCLLGGRKRILRFQFKS